MEPNIVSRSVAAHDPEGVLKVVLRPGEDGYVVAECLQLPGCMSQGKTEEEARRNIVDAIQSVLAVRLQQFLSESWRTDSSLVGIKAEETFRIKAPELEPISA